MRTLEFGSSVPEEFRVLAGRPLPVRQLLLHGCVEHLSLRDRDRQVEAVSNAETGFFRPVPISDDELLVFNYTAGASSRDDPSAATEDLSAITFLGEQIATSTRSCRAGRRIACSIRLRIGRRAQGDYKPAGELGLESSIPIIEGYKDSIGAACMRGSAIRSGPHSPASRAVQTDASSTPRSAPHAAPLRARVLGRRLSTGMPAIFTTCLAP